MTNRNIDVTGSLGLERGVVRLVPYDSAWPEFFELEAQLLRETTADKVRRIEHIGATSIPGMDAKPVLDLMAEVGSEAEALALVPAIETLGYEFRPDEDVPGRMYFPKLSSEGLCTHHLSLTVTGSQFWNRQILFRDYLRSHTEFGRRYIELKRALALQFPDDRPSYIEGKTEFVEMVIGLAELE